MRSIKSFFIVLALAFSASVTLSAQDPFADALEGNFERVGGNSHSYEPFAEAGTPAPKGYKPFYISHYGRHGSRRQIGSSGTEGFKYLEAAREAGILTAEGEKLYDDIKAAYECHVGMDGELTIRGGLEHQGIARRMFARFEPAFKSKDRKLIHCQASIVPRCLISMANFTFALKDEVPSLQYDFITGQKYIDLLAQDFYERDSYRKQQAELNDSLLRAYVSPDRMMKTFFTDSPATKEVIKDPHRFMRYLFSIAVDGQDLREELGGLDLLKWFTPEELIGLGKYQNERSYSSYGNNANWGDNIIWAAKPLVEDFIARADAAVAGNDVVADLRFGHDSGILPLAGLLGLKGPADRYPVGEAWKNGYFAWQNVPMATNLQMVFYRGKKNDVIVKILYNEHEMDIPALDEMIMERCRTMFSGFYKAPLTGPYYDWNDLRAYLVSISENKELGK